MNSKAKIAYLIVLVFLGSVASGFIFQVFLFPAILANSYFSQFQFIKNFKEGKIVINTKEQVIISEEQGLERAIEKIQKSVVSVGSGSGVIVTTDGLIITLSELVTSNTSVVLEGEKIKPEIVKRDIKNNLVLLKIPKPDLKTCGFCNAESVKLGEKVFLVGVNSKDQSLIANEGIVKSFNEETIRTNIFESSSLRGSPLFNLEGNLVGLNTIDSAGKVASIPIEKIKLFAGF